jgi:endonuclease/exonuclease/phosphatase family metal-dependent hydrolase
MKHLLFITLLFSASVQALTIGAYNIRNFDYDQRYNIRTNKPELANILKNLKTDVLSVEEINNSAEFEKFVDNSLPGYETAITTCGGAHGQKLGFIYNTSAVELLSFNEDLSVAEPGKEGSCYSGSRPLAIALFQIRSTKQRFYGVTAHLKSGSDPESVMKRTKQFELIKNIITELKLQSGVKDFYIAGDLNTTNYLNRGEDFRVLNKFVSDLGMINLSSSSACSAYWWGGTDDGIEMPSLLDHVIVSPGLMKKPGKTQSHGHCQQVACRQASLRELGISYESVSDHCPVTATIQ